MSKLLITQVKSVIGSNPKARKNVKALGLKKIGHTVERPDNSATRGMIFHCSHLVKVEEAK